MILHRPCSGAAPNRRAAFIGTNAVMRPGLRCRGAFSRSERVRDLPRDHQRQERVQLPGGDKNAMIAYSAQRILGGNDAHFSVWPALAYSPSLPLASWCQTSERMRRNFDVTPMAHLKE
jgi:hypothetical protein